MVKTTSHEAYNDIATEAVCVHWRYGGIQSGAYVGYDTRKEEKHGDDVHDRNDSHGSFARSDPLLATEETIERLRSAFS